MRSSWLTLSLDPRKRPIKELESMPQVKEAYVVFGEFDIVVKVEYSDRYDLNEAVMRQIRRVPTIKHTVTLLVI